MNARRLPTVLNNHKTTTNRLVLQSGVGLIEVLTALFILAFGALAISNVQISALTGVNVSTSHFAISTLTEEIAEQLKADPVQAGNGTYNTTYSDTTALPGTPTAVATFINDRKQATATHLTNGALQIDCAAANCDVSLRWQERLTGTGLTEQFYNLRIPLSNN